MRTPHQVAGRPESRPRKLRDALHARPVRRSIEEGRFISARSFSIVPVTGSFPLFHMFLDALISVFLSMRSRE